MSASDQTEFFAKQCRRDAEKLLGERIDSYAAYRLVGEPVAILQFEVKAVLRDGKWLKPFDSWMWFFVDTESGKIVSAHAGAP